MLPFQERVIEEKKELDVKIEKLTEFKKSETYTKLEPEERARLYFQWLVMQLYSNIPVCRIQNFK